jgi:hypothetical protein
VYLEQKCSIYELDHQVLLYGYGTTDSGEKHKDEQNCFNVGYSHGALLDIVKSPKPCTDAVFSSVFSQARITGW